MTIEMIYWDLGGVVVKDNVEPAFESFGLTWGDRQREAWRECMLGTRTVRDMYREALEGTGQENRLEELVQTGERMITLQPDGALPLMQALHDVGCKQGIISNHATEYGAYIRQLCGLDAYCDPRLIIVSADVHCDKRGTEIFDIALDRAGTAPEKTLFFDNLQRNIDVARSATATRAGLHAELFIDTQQAAGILRSTYDINVGEPLLEKHHGENNRH
ncbi:hypothetical protein HY490_05670 [Candidatus Woesearchaeota archaeon]|nr:hypothetical protein [Candidatus Woesearchaeota archaeon]